MIYKKPILHFTRNIALTECSTGSGASTDTTSDSNPPVSNAGTTNAACISGVAAIGANGDETIDCSNGPSVNLMAGCTDGGAPSNPTNCFTGSTP